MISTYLFWLTLWIPGYAALLRLFPRLLRFGWFGRLGLAYLLSLVALSPFVVAGYFLGLPVGGLTIVYAAFFLFALFDLTRGGRWRFVLRGAKWYELIPVALVLLDCVAGGIVGANLGGDAPTHVARGRWLLAHGLGFWDPYVATPTPMRTSHVNLHHFLLALGSRFSFTDILDVWKAFLFPAKLLVYSAIYLATDSVFRSRRAAWTAVAFFIGATAPITYMTYPNKLCALWLVPLQLAFTVELIRGRASIRTASLFLGFTSLMMGLFHPLYVFFGALYHGAALLVWAGLPSRRRGRFFVPALATTAGLPFLVGSILLPHFSRPLPPVFAQLIHRVGSFSMVSPTIATTSHGFVDAYLALPLLLVVLALFVYMRATRAVALWISGIVLGVANLLYNPLLATPVLSVLPEGFILFRMGGILVVCSIVYLGGAAGVGLDRLFRSFRGPRAAWGAALVLPACLLLGSFWGTRFFLEPPWDWPSYRADVRRGAPRLRPNYEDLHLLREVLEERVPVGSVVLAEPLLGYHVSAVHPAPVVAIPIEHTNYCVPDAPARRREIRALLAPIPAEETTAALQLKSALLDKYQVRFLLRPLRGTEACRMLPVERLGPVVESDPYALHWIEPASPAGALR